MGTIFNCYDLYKAVVGREVIKHNMRFITMIPAGYTLSEEECWKYYGAGLDKVKIATSSKNRYVFDKLVIPLPSYVQILKEE